MLVAVRVLPASANGVGSGSLWRAKAAVYNPFKRFGAAAWDNAQGFEYAWSQDPAVLVSPPSSTGTGQRVLMRIDIRTSDIAMNGPIAVFRTVYQVT